ncbi:DUF5666 domain-containing protein [Alkalisalibacterium limincola]|uniref:DUF5666 domain-containing protein n=1 Tax=Alkalisalibacterium limincola TaxID=2699169 RepID=A0A5C8KXJ9_9GAMM|nr:DUF5666 domain-containing protein [Alkalisalibacterium limincola]TXK65119.1 hypothetical protein FU658_04935 [Alkalisalibacterium limincola]
MKRAFAAISTGLLLAIAAPVALADENEIKGYVESIDWASQSVMVQGIVFYTDHRTEYDDDLRYFGDLRVGDEVEVEFIYRHGVHIATEIELED